MATITVSGSDTSAPGEITLEPQTITGSEVLGEVLAVDLASGDNTIDVPPGAVGCVIVPPASNATALKVRTNLNSADGGTPIAPAEPYVQGFASGTTSVILNAAAAISSFTRVYFV